MRYRYGLTPIYMVFCLNSNYIDSWIEIVYIDEPREIIDKDNIKSIKIEEDN